MAMPAFFTFTAITLLTLGTMVLHLRSNTVLTKTGVFWFTASYIVMGICILAQMLGEMANGSTWSVGVHIFINLVELCFAPFIPVLLALSCGVVKPARYVASVVVLHAIVQIVMSFSGGIFYIDEANFYCRGPYYIIYIIAYVISTTFMLVSFRLVGKKFQNRDGLTLFWLTVVACVGIGAAIYDGDITTGLIGPAIASVLLYIYYEDLSQQDLQRDNEAKAKRIQDMQSGTIMGMAKLIESRDGSTGEHVKNSAHYVDLLAHEAQRKGVYSDRITDEFISLLVSAAPLHDIGKISVPDQILNKAGRFTDEEFKMMQSHAEAGGRIILDVLSDLTDADFTQMAAEVAHHHQEKWDGSGYPDGLKGEEIPLSARIMALADVYDALVAKRVYKPGMPKEKALRIISEGCGTHFDPVLTPIFVDMMQREDDSDVVRKT